MKEKWFLLIIFIIAFILRLNAIISLPDTYLIPTADAGEYDELARNLLSEKGYIFNDSKLPTALRMPLYPIFLAGIYFIFGHNVFVVQFIQCIMSAFLCIIIFYIAKIIFNKSIAILSTIILIFYQPYIFYLYFGGPAFILSENLFIFLFALFLLCWVKNYYISSGVLLALATLTRPITILLPLFLLIYKYKYALKKFMLFLICFVLVMSPWIIRNYIVHKAFIPTTTYAGNIFWLGNNPQSKGCAALTIEPEPYNKFELAEIRKINEVKWNRIYQKGGIDYLTKNYKKIPKLFFKKLLIFWDVFNIFEKFYGYNIWYGIILSFAIYGIIKNFSFKLPSFILILNFIYFTFVSILAVAEPRLRYPIELYLIIFCSWTIWQLFQKYRLSFQYFLLIIISIICSNILFYIFAEKIFLFLQPLM